MAISLSKGQKIDLTKTNPGLDKIVAGLGWDVNKYDGGSDFDLDVAIFMLDDNGKVYHEKGFVYYGNKQDPAGSVIHSGDNLTGVGDGDDESIFITLSQVPTAVQRICFTVTIYDAEARKHNFGQVNNAYIRILDDQKQELIRYDLGEDFSIETALVVAELYRHNGEWKFNAVGAGYQGGLKALAESYGLNIA